MDKEEVVNRLCVVGEFIIAMMGQDCEILLQRNVDGVQKISRVIFGDLQSDEVVLVEKD